MRSVRHARRSLLAAAGSLLILAGLLPVAAAPVLAAPTELFFSEYIEGSSNNKALEIYNGTGAAVDLAAGGYSVQMFFNGSVTAGLTVNLTGTVADGDVHVVATTTSAAAILAQADQTSGSGFFNGDDAVTLRKGTSVIDSIGQAGIDPGTEWGTGLTSTADNTLRRKSTIESGDTNPADAFDPAVQWDGFATDTFDGLGSHAVNEPDNDPVINEFVVNHLSTDTFEYVEIRGEPNTDYSDLAILEIEGDFSGTATGLIDEVVFPATTNATGHWVTGFLDNAFENGTATLLLVRGLTGTVGDDLDTDDDGDLDATLWTEILDAVAVNDGGATDLTYGVPVLGVAYDGQPFSPGGASRIPDGTDTDTAADWVRNDFDLAGIPSFPGTLVAGEALNTPGAPNATAPAEQAPAVSSTSPADGATDIPANTDIEITFSEDVVTAGDWFTIQCTSGPRAATVSGSGATRTIDPDADFAGGDVCTVTIVGANVTDVDANDPPDAMIADYVFGFTVAAAAVVTPIHEIQMDDASSEAGTFTIEGIVVGDYQTQGSGQLRGFFVQEEDADVDADPATSEGIFVFCGACPVDVSVGDAVRVSGSSSEFFDMTQLTASTASSVSVLGSDNPLPTAATVELPVPGVPSGDLAVAIAAINTYYEAREGMLVTYPDTLSVAEYFELARYGQVILTEGGRPHTFTAVSEPSAAGFINHEIDLARRTVILDDEDNRQNRPSDSPNTPYYYPTPGLSTTDFFRGGDTITNLTGVLHWSFAGQTGTDAWRIRPVTEAYSYTFDPANPRPAAPDVEGSLKVASFNVLNYFLTIDTTSSNDVGICGPSRTQDCRGADSNEELQRQRTKLLEALEGLDADVIGLMEMENTPGVEPLADIVAGLPGYDFVDTGVIGTDTIRVGIIYRTSTVQPVGEHAVLDTQAFVNPRGADVDRNRPAVAQTFEEIATGGRLTVVVNHLKSKGSGCGSGDDDTTTGQGNCTLTRTLAAQELAEWLATDPTGSGDRDVLIIGDLNSYAKEDPIVALQSAGYTDLVAKFGGPDAYGYVFDGQLGYLDHALSSPTLTPQVRDVEEWHINADEIPLFDYNDDVRTSGEAAFEEESDVLPLYEPNEFRTSDHDPIVVGLDLLDYEFDGFFAPVDNPPALNRLRAGQSVPFNFDLADGLGLDVLFAAPSVRTFVCDSGVPGEDIDPGAAPGGSGLQLDPETGEYTYVWKTSKGWAGTCRQFEITFRDGTYRTADFRFR